MTQQWTPETLMQMRADTTGYFPAGDWVDSRAHLPILYTIARFCTAPPYGDPCVPSPAPLVMEIGVRQGPSTIAILMAMRETGGRLISLDIDDVEPAVCAQIAADQGLAPFWEFHCINADDFDLGGQQLDFLWIDGEHKTPQPEKDWTRFEGAVKVNGLIAMHDLFMEPWRPQEDGVLRAVEIAKGTGRYEVMTLPWSYGLTLMRKLA